MTNKNLSMVPAMPVRHTRHSADGRECPLCGSPVFRISRRLRDRLLGFFVATLRYRCISMDCSWEGNLRQKQKTYRLPV
jgi:hypothetical protein